MIRVVWGRCATDTVVPLGGPCDQVSPVLTRAYQVECQCFQYSLEVPSANRIFLVVNLIFKFFCCSFRRR
jgi:hypothetical protein